MKPCQLNVGPKVVGLEFGGFHIPTPRLGNGADGGQGGDFPCGAGGFKFELRRLIVQTGGGFGLPVECLFQRFFSGGNIALT